MWERYEMKRRLLKMKSRFLGRRGDFYTKWIDITRSSYAYSSGLGRDSQGGPAT
jgi:hypothetical protein